MAVGASRGPVLGLVLRHAAELASAGLAIGLFATSMAARLVGSLLYEVRPFDLVTLATVSTLLIVVALLASYLPARRAANADPVKSLRCE